MNWLRLWKNFQPIRASLNPASLTRPSSFCCGSTRGRSNLPSFPISVLTPIPCLCIASGLRFSSLGRYSVFLGLVQPKLLLINCFAVF